MSLYGEGPRPDLMQAWEILLLVLLQLTCLPIHLPTVPFQVLHYAYERGDSDIIAVLEQVYRVRVSGYAYVNPVELILWAQIFLLKFSWFLLRYGRHMHSHALGGCGPKRQERQRTDSGQHEKRSQEGGCLSLSLSLSIYIYIYIGVGMLLYYI